MGVALSNVRVQIGVAANTKEDAITSLISLLGKTEYLNEIAIVKRLVERENNRSTTINNKAAIPHCICHAQDILVAVSVLPKPIEWGKDKKVDIVCCVLGPKRLLKDYIHTIIFCGHLFSDKATRELLIKATTVEEAERVVKDAVAIMSKKKMVF